VAEAESLIREAHAAGQRALLDFTGPSCVNCQAMAKQVFPLGVVRQAWNRGLPIELDTDRHAELAQWQQSRFQTQARPLYVRLDPGGDEARWSEAISPKNGEDVARLAVFLVGGAGSDAGSGAGLVQFLLLAVAGGLVTLLMPCTYPMIPFTLNFFARQVASGRRLVPLAMFYGLGIVGCFVGVGVFITGVLRLPLAQVAGHPLTNLAIAALFVVFGLSLLGVVVLRLPAVLEGRLGGSRAGYFGALLMGLTFAVSAFTCAAPFAGTILAQAVADGTWRYAAWGMAVYSAVIALPFVLLALAPGVLTRLPKAGAWMNEVKIAGGFIELAAALKFLVICDAQWRWGVFGRTTVLAAWAAAALVIGLYVFGRLRLPGDVRLTEIGVGRLLTGLAFIALGLWFVAGLTGANLGVIEAFFPADAAPL
jgi:thiol:disulfide interchange protein DsbD